MIDFKALLAALGAPRCSMAEMTSTTSRLVISWMLLPAQGPPDFAAKEPRDLSGRAVLGYTLRDEGFQQVLDAVCYDPSPCFPLFGRKVAPLELRSEHLLCSHTCLMKRYAPIWPNGIFAQLRPCSAGAVQNDKHFASFWSDLHAEAGRSGYPNRRRSDAGVGSASIALLVNLMRGMERRSCPAVLPSLHIGSTANEITGTNVILGPH